MTNFVSKNKAAQIQQNRSDADLSSSMALLLNLHVILYSIHFSCLSVISCRDGGELSTRDMQKIVQSLPKYNEQVEKISLHVEVCSVLLNGTGLV